ncbi:hypothetical protein ADUPG1_000710, partial [Aduncisulcus paluster]
CAEFDPPPERDLVTDVGRDASLREVSVRSPSLSPTLEASDDDAIIAIDSPSVKDEDDVYVDKGVDSQDKKPDVVTRLLSRSVHMLKAQQELQGRSNVGRMNGVGDTSSLRKSSSSSSSSSSIFPTRGSTSFSLASPHPSSAQRQPTTLTSFSNSPRHCHSGSAHRMVFGIVYKNTCWSM